GVTRPYPRGEVGEAAEVIVPYHPDREPSTAGTRPGCVNRALLPGLPPYPRSAQMLPAAPITGEFAAYSGTNPSSKHAHGVAFGAILQGGRRSATAHPL